MTVAHLVENPMRVMCPPAAPTDQLPPLADDQSVPPGVIGPTEKIGAAAPRRSK